MRQQRSRDGHEESVVADAAQIFTLPSCSEPAAGGQHEKKLFIGSPREGARGALKARVSIPRDRPSDREVRVGRFDSCESHGSTCAIGVPAF
jgi:hypothetical protein